MIFVSAYLLLGAFTGTLALLVVLFTLSKRTIAAGACTRMVLCAFLIWPWCWCIIAGNVVERIRNG